MSTPIRERLMTDADYCDARVAATVRAIGRDCREAAAIITELLEALEAIVGHYAGQTQDGNAPGHGHLVSGIWDDDNNPIKAGKPCQWCAQWNAALHVIAKAKGETA
jgi:hypothetical protein